jgi:2'-5' RNA ligase
MKRRVFLAINPGPQAQEYLQQIQDQIDSSFEACPIRWARPFDLHITLAFIGMVGEPEIVKIREAIMEVCALYGYFSLGMDRASFAPKGEIPPRYVWIGFKNDKRFEEMQKTLTQKLLQRGIRLDGKPFVCHITLGRVKQFEYRRIDPEEMPEITQDLEFSFPAGGISLMESRKTIDGAEYSIIETHKFSGKA